MEVATDDERCAGHHTGSRPRVVLGGVSSQVVGLRLGEVDARETGGGDGNAGGECVGPIL